MHIEQQNQARIKIKHKQPQYSNKKNTIQHHNNPSKTQQKNIHKTESRWLKVDGENKNIDKTKTPKSSIKNSSTTYQHEGGGKEAGEDEAGGRRCRGDVGGQ